MPVPDYQTLMLPLLRFASDDGEHSLKEAVENAAVTFKLNDEERQELMPSGIQTKIYNRLTWARSALERRDFLQPHQVEDSGLHRKESVRYRKTRTASMSESCSGIRLILQACRLFVMTHPQRQPLTLRMTK